MTILQQFQALDLVSILAGFLLASLFYGLVLLLILRRVLFEAEMKRINKQACHGMSCKKR